MPLPPCLPSLSPFMISLLGCSWLPLPPCIPSLSLFMVSHVSSWLPLPPGLPTLSPFMIFVLGCSWLPLPPCIPSMNLYLFTISLPRLLLVAAASGAVLDSLFALLLATAAALSSFSPLLDFLFELLLATAVPSLSPFSLSFLRLPPCFPSLSSSFLLRGCWQLSPRLPVLSRLSPFVSLYLWFLCLSNVIFAIYPYRMG